MKFDDFPLMFAVSEVYEEIKAEKQIEELETPGARSDDWLREEARRLELTKRINLKMIQPDEELLGAFVKYAKAPKNGCDEKPKLHLMMDVARRHGTTCFYSFKGGCSDDVDLDRIIPGGPYSVANCVIACSYHNRQRGNRDFGEYCNE